MSRSSGRSLLRERARERAWAPMRERVELLCVLSVLRDEVDAYDTFLEQAAEAVAEHYDGGASLSVLSDDERVMNVIGVHHPDPLARAALEGFLEAPVPVLDTVEGPAIGRRAGRIFRFDDVDFEHRPQAQRYAAVSRATHGAVVPMRARGGLTGLLWLSVCQALTADDLRFLDEVASRIGLVVDNLRLQACDVHAEAASVAGPVGQLTEREREILVLVARGMTSKQIAEQLVLSARTVEWHRSRIQTKLGVSGRAELTRIAHECRLVGAAA